MTAANTLGCGLQYEISISKFGTGTQGAHWSMEWGREFRKSTVTVVYAY